MAAILIFVMQVGNSVKFTAKGEVSVSVLSHRTTAATCDITFHISGKVADKPPAQGRSCPRMLP